MTSKILILGGSPFQIPLIKRAKELGLYVITCDYLPSNPGHAYADEYHNVSTTDKNAVLNIAREFSIDAITTFASDPAVPTVAYVAEQLGLPGPNLIAVEILTEKDKFRELMRVNGLNIPECFSVSSAIVPEGINPEKLYIVKPVDSSGSKGITKSTGAVNALIKAIEYALSFSRSGRCIIESVIDGKQIHGDAFIQDGKVVYAYLGDHYFYTETNSFIPISTRWPTSVPHICVNSVIEQVEIISIKSGYINGPVNIEARIDSNNVAYIIEVGPRNGGNFVPIIQQRLTGFDFTQAVIDVAMGKPVEADAYEEFRCGAYYILHAESAGRFKGLDVPEFLKDKVFGIELFKKIGEEVRPYTGSNETIGVCLFDSGSDSLHDVLTNHPPKVLIG